MMVQKLQLQTQSHYDKYPFIEGGANRISWWRDYLRDFMPAEDIEDKFIIDVGSSVGEISRGLLDRGARMLCFDLSLQSLRRCRQVNPEAQVVHGSALDLPFPDGAFDHAISIGVLHHTPDCRRGFKELSRVVAPGGTVVVFLYNWWNIYNPIYNGFKPVRALLPLDRVPRLFLRLLQPFVKGHLGQSLSDQELRNLLGDKLWTPQATFHSLSEVCKWGEEEGLEFVANKKFYLGYANVMQFKKRGLSDPSVRRDLALKCLGCGKAPMRPSGAAYLCEGCGQSYGSDGGIVDCLAE
jgi:SAM-dependent methyltransferase